MLTSWNWGFYREGIFSGGVVAVFFFKTLVKKGTIFLKILIITRNVLYGIIMVALQSVSTFEIEVRNLLSTLEPHSTDSLGHQHGSKSVSTSLWHCVKVKQC